MKLNLIPDFYNADRIRIYHNQTKIADFPTGYQSTKTEIFLHIDQAIYGNREVVCMGIHLGTPLNDKDIVFEIMIK